MRVLEYATSKLLFTLQVKQEAEDCFGGDEAEPSRHTVDNMHFTLAVLKEALRKYSVVPVVTRDLREDDELGGYKVPAGSMVVCCLQVRRRGKGVWI